MTLDSLIALLVGWDSASGSDRGDGSRAVGRTSRAEQKGEARPERTAITGGTSGQHGGDPAGNAARSRPFSVDRDALDRVTSARLVGPLLRAADAGAVEFDDGLAAEADRRQRAALAWCLKLESRVCSLHDDLLELGIRPVVLKGIALAHLEQDPVDRTFADADLLVAGADMDRVVAAGAKLGGRRPFAERRSGYDARFGKSVTLRWPDGVEIDLHRSLADGVFGARVPLAELHRDAEPFPLAGREMYALSPAHRIAHTIYHLALGGGPPRPHNLRDLALAVTRAGAPIEEMVDAVRRWRGEAVLAAALAALVESGTPARSMDEPLRTLANEPVPSKERARLARHVGEGSSFGWAKLDVLAELSARDRVAYGLALMWPSEDHLRSRGLGRVDLLRRGRRPRG